MKFTVIIPTRERADTLQHSLATVVAQDYADLTILVSDNASTDNTRAVVESFKDSRIRYVNTGRRVQMTSNFEFALQHVDSGFLCYLGDDDGLLPNAISTASRILEQFQAQALTWRYAAYSWPNFPAPYERNRLLIPFDPLVVRRDGKRQMRRFLTGSPNHFHLASLYTNGFVSVELIRKLQAQWPDRRFFRSAVPDVYAGIIMTRELESFPHSLAPLSIMGGSGNSNGGSVYAAWTGSGDGSGSEHLRTESEVKEVPFTSRIPKCRSFGFVYGDPLLAAAETADGSIPNEAKLIAKILDWIVRDVSQKPLELYVEGVASARQAAARYGLRAMAETLIARYPHRPPSYPTTAAISQGKVLFHDYLHLNAAEFGITNVNEAARFCGNLLGYVSGQPLALQLGGEWREKVLSLSYRVLRRLIAPKPRVSTSDLK